jgi:putative endonuclease
MKLSPEKYFVYIIKSEEWRFYIWYTIDIIKRIKQHNEKNFIKWTNNYNNWELVYKEEFNTKKEALIREKQIKSYKWWDWFKRLFTKSM